MSTIHEPALPFPPPADVAADQAAPFLTMVEAVLKLEVPALVLTAHDAATYFNDACRQVAVSPAARQGRPLSEIAPALESRIRDAVDRAWAGHSGRIDDLLLPADEALGREDQWVEVAVSPVGRAPKASAVLCLIRDLTNERRLAHQLDAVKASSAALVDLLPTFLWRLDAGGAVRWMNDRVQAYLGVTLSQARQEGWMGWLHPSEREQVLAAWGRSVAEGAPFEHRHRLRDSQGAYHICAFRLLPQFDANGTLAGWHGAAIEMAAPDDPVRASSDRALLWVADLQSRSLRALNPEPSSEWPPVDDGNLFVWDAHLAAVFPDDRENLVIAFEALATGQATDFSYRARNRSGSPLFITNAGYPVRDENGQVRQVYGAAHLRHLMPTEIAVVDPSGRLGDVALKLQDAGFRLRHFSTTVIAGRLRSTIAGAIYASASTVPDILESLINLRRELPDTPIIVIGDPQASPREILDLNRAGMNEIISYRSDPEVSVEIIREHFENHFENNAVTLPSVNPKALISKLSVREREIVEMAIQGGTSKTIGRALNLSPRTIDFHRSRALDKLGVRSVAQASALFLP